MAIDNDARMVIASPAQQFVKAQVFQGLFNGSVFVGAVDTDPSNPLNQVPVFVEQEDGSTVEVPQPIRTNAAGFPVHNGKVVKFTTAAPHSMAVYDSVGVLQFYYPNTISYNPNQLFALLSSSGGAAEIGSSNGNVQTDLDQLNAFMSSVRANNGFNSIGRCADIAALKNLDPTVDGERVLVSKYLSAMPHAAGGGEFQYKASITADTVKAKDLDVMVFKTSSGKYFERVGVSFITPYLAGAWGDWDPVAKTGHNDTSAMQAAIKCAESTPIYFAGKTLVGDVGKFNAYVPGCGNVFRQTTTLEVRPLLVSTNWMGSVRDFSTANFGTASAPLYGLLFVHDTDAQNHQVSYQALGTSFGAFASDFTNHSYHVHVGFETRNGVNTGFRMQIQGGILEGGWRNIVTAKEHFYFCTFDNISSSHASDFAFYGYVERDSGEQVIVNNCKFFQSKNIARAQNGVWHFHNTSFDYQYTDGNQLDVPSGFVNLTECFFECYRERTGYMIYQRGGNFPCIVNHVNTRFVKLSNPNAEPANAPMGNTVPFYVGPGAAHYGDKAEFDKVWQIDGVSDELRLRSALHAGAGGKCAFTNTKIPTVNSGENNARWSFPPALVPAGNVTKNGVIDNAWMGSTNADFRQCGSYVGLTVFGQSGVIGGPAPFNPNLISWTESGAAVATLLHNANGLVFNVSAGATPGQVYNAIVGAIPSSDFLAYLPQVTYTSDAEFTLTLYQIKTTKSLSNTAVVDFSDVRVLSQAVAISLPVRSSVDTIPNVAPYQEAVQFGGLKGSAQASHVLMCISSKTVGATFTMKNGSFVTI